MGNENEVVSAEDAGMAEAPGPAVPPLGRVRGSRRRPSAQAVQEEPAPEAKRPARTRPVPPPLDLAPPASSTNGEGEAEGDQTFEAEEEEAQDSAPVKGRKVAVAFPRPPTSLKMPEVTTHRLPGPVQLPMAGQSDRPEKPKRRPAPSSTEAVTTDWLPEGLRDLAPEGLEGDALVKFVMAALKGRESAFDQREQMAILEEKLEGIAQCLAILGDRTAKLLAINEELQGPRNIQRRRVDPSATTRRPASQREEGDEGLNLGPPSRSRPTRPAQSRRDLVEEEEIDDPEELLIGNLAEVLEQEERGGGEFSTLGRGQPGRAPRMTQADVNETWAFVTGEMPVAWRQVAVRAAKIRLTQWTKPGGIRPDRWKNILWMDAQQVFEPATEGDGGSSDGVSFER